MSLLGGSIRLIILAILLLGAYRPGSTALNAATFELIYIALLKRASKLAGAVCIFKFLHIFILSPVLGAEYQRVDLLSLLSLRLVAIATANAKMAMPIAHPPRPSWPVCITDAPRTPADVPSTGVDVDVVV